MRVLGCAGRASSRWPERSSCRPTHPRARTARRSYACSSAACAGSGCRSPTTRSTAGTRAGRGTASTSAAVRSSSWSRPDDPHHTPMTLSLNRRARELADRLAADGDALRTAARILPGGTRVIDCGSAVPGGLEAGRRFAEITMAELGSVTFGPLVLGGRWLPGLTVVTDHPALACLGSQYAGWQIDREGYFAMASGPGRALIRAEQLFDDLDVDERSSAAVLCLETRDEPPAELAAHVAERAGVAQDSLTLLFAPTASLAGGVQVAARIVETALHKLHEIEFD